MNLLSRLKRVLQEAELNQFGRKIGPGGNPVGMEKLLGWWVEEDSYTELELDKWGVVKNEFSERDPIKDRSEEVGVGDEEEVLIEHLEWPTKGDTGGAVYCLRDEKLKVFFTQNAGELPVGGLDGLTVEEVLSKLEKEYGKQQEDAPD